MAASDAGIFCVDRSFADGGLVRLDLDGVENLGFAAQALAVQADGKVVLGGIGGPAPRFTFATLRLREDGALDPAFGDGGLAKVDFGGAAHSLEALDVQADGKVLVAGSVELSLADGGLVLSTAVAQLLADGTLDSTFGDGGTLLVRHGDGYELVNGQVRLPDGRHRLAGQCRPFATPGAINLCVIGLHPDGRADLGFGDAGLVEFDIAGADDFGGVLAVDSVGRLLIPSTSYDLTGSPPGFNFGLARLLPDGQLDPSFTDDGGRPGRVTTDFFGRSDSCNVVLAQPDGRVVCAGNAGAADGGEHFVLARYLGDGTLDPSFGSGGKATFDLGGRAGVRALTLLADQTLAAAGYAANPSGDLDFVLAFLAPQGGLDLRYGAAGIMRFDVSRGRDDAVHSLELDRSGRLLLSGEAGAVGGNDLAVMRLTSCVAVVPDAGTPDAGTPDAGTPDAGTPDAGTPDAGTPDAGTPDAGTSDAGTSDAGFTDAGLTDAGEAPDPAERQLQVGCGCGAAPDAALLLLAMALFPRRRHPKRSVASRR